MMERDPRVLVAESPMHWRQIVAIAVCFLLIALDGFDMLSISFASPGIAREWGIDRAALGVVLSMELFGMAAGSVLLGPLADRRGRRPVALLCLVIMASGMYATSLVATIGALSATRLYTGIGIGGMLACTNAMAAEFANDRRRGAAVSLMAAGYPVGAITGGSMATSLLESGSWRDVFTFGAIATAAFLPIVLILVPETVASIMQQRPADILDRVNQALRRIGKATIDALPDSSDQAHAKVAWATLFAPELRRVTILLTFTYFAHILTFYFIIKWVPKIVADLGFSPASAGGVLVWANIGGLIGALLFSALTMKAALRPLLAAAMFASALAVVWFGRGQPDLAGLSQAAAVAGFFINAGIVGFYALAAASFPAALRAGGTGFAIGVGRSGAALAPIFAGILFAGGFGLQAVAAIMALGSLFAAFAVLAMPKCNAPTHETAVPLGRL